MNEKNNFRKTRVLFNKLVAVVTLEILEILGDPK